MTMPPNQSLHTNRRPRLGGDAPRLSDAGRPASARCRRRSVSVVVRRRYPSRENEALDSHDPPNRSNQFGGDSYGCHPKPSATKGTVAVRSRSVRRGLVIYSLRQSAATRSPCGFVFGRAGFGRGRRGGRRAICRQRPCSLLAVASRTGGFHRPLWTLPTSFRGPHCDPPVVRRARASSHRHFVADLRPLGRELERRTIQDTHRCVLPTPR